MKPSFLYLILLHALVVVLGLGLWKSCNKTPELKYALAKTNIEYKYDTIKVAGVLPKPPKPDTIILVTPPENVDTSAVIKEYYSKNIYNRPFEDSSISITLVDTVFENKLQKGTIEYKILRPTQVITNIFNPVDPPKRKLFLGAELRSDTSLSVNAFLLDKKDRLFGVGYDPFNKAFSISGAIRILKWK